MLVQQPSHAAGRIEIPLAEKSTGNDTASRLTSFRPWDTILLQNVLQLGSPLKCIGSIRLQISSKTRVPRLIDCAM